MLSAVVYIVLRDGGDGGGGYGCRYLIQGIQDGVAVLRLNDGDTGCPVVSKVKRPDSRRVVGCSASSVADGGISRRIRGSPARGALPSSWICLLLLRLGSLYLFLSLLLLSALALQVILLTFTFTFSLSSFGFELELELETESESELDLPSLAGDCTEIVIYALRRLLPADCLPACLALPSNLPAYCLCLGLPLPVCLVCLVSALTEAEEQKKRRNLFRV